MQISDLSSSMRQRKPKDFLFPAGLESLLFKKCRNFKFGEEFSVFLISNSRQIFVCFVISFYQKKIYGKKTSDINTPTEKSKQWLQFEQKSLN